MLQYSLHCTDLEDWQKDSIFSSESWRWFSFHGEIRCHCNINWNHLNIVHNVGYRKGSQIWFLRQHQDWLWIFKPSILDNLWSLTGRQQFAELLHTTNEKKNTALEDTCFKIQMFIFTNLDKSFLASDTELVNNYSYSAVRGRIEKDLQEKGNSARFGAF